MANIELDGANKKIKVDSGDLTLDVPGDIVLDADGGDVVFADGGTNLLKVTNSSSDVVLQPQVDTKDIVFKQYDGTVVATVEDNATFNIPTDKLAINGTAVTSTAAELNILDGVTSTTAELNIMDGVTATAAEINLIDGGTARGTTAIADGDGVLINDAGTMRQTTVETLKTYIGGGTNTPNFSVTRNSNQTGVSDNTSTKIQFNNVQYDTASGWSSSDYWWVVPSNEGGKYYISCSAYLSGGGHGYIDQATVLLYGGNGTSEIDVVEHSNSQNNFDTIILKFSGIYSLSAGDKINVHAQINVDGGTARIDGSGSWDYTHLQLAKIIE